MKYSKEKFNEYQRMKRKQDGNAYTRKYEKTPSGFLMRLYRNMKSRTSGIQKQKAHLYTGKTLLTKEEFYDWAKGSDDFYEMFSLWEQSGYDRRLTPTVDRVDSSQGYEIWNMRWLTHSENSRIGALHARGRYE